MFILLMIKHALVLRKKKLACRLVRCWVGEIVSVSQRGLYDSSTRVP